jgi:hypothetical protein
MATTFGLILSKKFLIKKRGFISIATSSESERTQPKFPYRSESILLRLFLMLLFTEFFRGTERRTIRSVQDLYRLSHMAWDKARSWSPPFEACLSGRNLMMRQRAATMTAPCPKPYEIAYRDPELIEWFFAQSRGKTL